MNVKCKIGIIGFGLLLSIMVKAQPDCRSIIGAHLKPIGQTPVSWAVEGLAAAALMPDRVVANWNLYGAIDYNKGNHQFYFEGAYKDYFNSASNPDGEEAQTDLPDYNRPKPTTFGLRELNYKYTNSGTRLAIGVQGIHTADYFLFDERMLGLSTSKKWNTFEVSAQLGTVTEQIARFSNVCGTRHIYNIIHRSQYNFVGDRPFETNFGALFLIWRPSSKKPKLAEPNYINSFNSLSNEGADEFTTDEFGSSDEFSNDEFGESDEFSITSIDKKSKRQLIKLDEIGTFFYEEFGEGFHEYKYYSGAFTQVLFPYNIELKGELVNQYILNDHALAYWFSLTKSNSWGNGSSTKFKVAYLDKINIDNNAHFYPAFANLFLGEVLKLDAIDLPLASLTIKHYFNNKYKPTLQLNGVMQIKRDRSSELDILAGVKLFNHMRITGILGYMSSDLLEQDYWLTRLEVRIAL